MKFTFLIPVSFLLMITACTPVDPAVSYEQQSIGLDSVLNARELGGYQMADGRTVKHGKFIRSADLGHASDRDIERLSEEFCVVRVFDLRSEYEAGRLPDRDLPGAEHRFLPVLDDSGMTADDLMMFKAFSGKDPDALVRLAKSDIGKDFSDNMYTNFLLNEYTQLQYASFLQTVLHTDHGATLWHCSQGKDRTGLAAAILLLALGADMDLVMADFELSNVVYQPVVDQFAAQAREQGATDADIEVIQTFMGVNPRVFRLAFDEVERTYGSLHDYIVNQLCFTDQEMEQLRNKYLR